MQHSDRLAIILRRIALLVPWSRFARFRHSRACLQQTDARAQSCRKRSPPAFVLTPPVEALPAGSSVQVSQEVRRGSEDRGRKACGSRGAS
mgnify:CR=1 FL=1